MKTDPTRLLSACLALCVFIPTRLAAAEAAIPPQEPGRWVQGVGYVEPRTEIRRLAFRYPGLIGLCRSQVGQSVKRGEVLMEQDNAEEKAALALAESNLLLAQRELAKVLAGINPHEIHAKEQAQHAAQTEAEYAQRHAQRVGKLAGNQFAGDAERDLADSDLRRKQALQRQLQAETAYLQHYVRTEDRALAEARVVQAEKSLEAARQRLEQTLLRAPIDGTVLEILHREGESTHLMGNADPVLLLGDTEHLRLRAELNETYALHIKAGQKALIFGRAMGGREIHGTVVQVKQLMGKKTVFSKAASERKDVDIIQALVEPDEAFSVPLGMELDVKVELGAEAKR